MRNSGILFFYTTAGHLCSSDSASRNHFFVRMLLYQNTKIVRSHVCWHVYGLLHRSDRNYNEAIKAYKQALRIDKDNLQILRDLSLLQIQMRDLSGFALTRHTILNLKPNNKIHWLAFALAKHLTGDNDGAISVIDCYLDTLDENSAEKQRGFESSELAMYRYEVLNEIPNNEEVALKYLDECKDLVMDQTSWLFAKARCQLTLGDYDGAKESFLDLLRRGSTEDYRVHSGYMCAILQLDRESCGFALKLRATNTVATTFPLTSEQRAVLVDAYTNDLPTIFPSSAAVAWIPVTLLEGVALRHSIDQYCRKNLSRGVPSLGSDLSSLFLARYERKDNGDKKSKTRSSLVVVKDPLDLKCHPMMVLLVELVDSYVESLATRNTFPGDETDQSPSTLLWAMYLRTQLHAMCGEYEEGLVLIEKCISHTPTSVDMYELKGRLLKLSGDVGAAADCVDSARMLDLQDRYINNKATKYLLRANRESMALERVALFTKDEDNPEQHMYNMQCTWYELELAACYARKGEWGKALKKYSECQNLSLELMCFLYGFLVSRMHSLLFSRFPLFSRG